MILSNPVLEQEKSYRKVMKNSLIVGGAQFIQLLVALIRTKILVLFVGPVGMGVFSLLNSGIITIHQFTSLGIFQSAVRELSGLFTSGNELVYAKTRKIYLLLTLCAGILAAGICVLLAHALSGWIFENDLYSTSFYIVALALVFMAFQYAMSSLIQARQRLLLLAKATIFGALMNLALTVPIIYFFKMDGIAPIIVAGSLTMFLSHAYFERKIVLPHPGKILKNEWIQISKPIVQLGFILMFSNLAMALFNFLLNTYLTRFGSLQDVGYYQSAWSVCFQSIFIANATLTSDYYPRIAAIKEEPEKLNRAVNEQLAIMLYIVAPIAAGVIVFAPWLVRLLLSESFLVVVPILQVMAVSLVFRVIWVVFGVLILAKGKKWDYCKYDALLGNGLVFLLNIMGYAFWGLSGLAYSVCIGSVIMMLWLGSIARFRFKIHIHKSFLMDFFIFALLLLLIYGVFQVFFGYFCALLEGILFSAICGFALFRLNQKVNIRDLVKTKFQNAFS